MVFELLRFVAPGAHAFLTRSSGRPTDGPGLLYYLCRWCTYGMFALNLLEFCTGRAVPGTTLSGLYFVILAAYAGDRELGHWRQAGQSHAEIRMRKGEWFVFAWVVFAFFAAAASGLFPEFIVPLTRVQVKLRMPHELAAITLEVIAIFFGTQASKHFRDSRPGNAPPGAGGLAGPKGQLPTIEDLEKDLGHRSNLRIVCV